MSNHKTKNKTVNNINQLNLEIDYNKLADAIIEAQERKRIKTESASNRKGFFSAALKILKGKKVKMVGFFLSLLN